MGHPNQTHCRKRHELTFDNVFIERGARRCLECRREKDRARYANNPARKAAVKARAEAWNGRGRHRNTHMLPPASQWLNLGAMQ